MADVREKSTTTTTGPAEDTPQVEVYDNNNSNTARIMHDDDRPMAANSTYATTARSDAGLAQPATNWTSIILGLLVVIGLILLLMWLL